ncbi:MAG: DinB family protein [Dehalococcoidia bacterium]
MAPEYPAFNVQETATRLADSLQTLEWATSLVPPQWTHALPDYYSPGEWSVAMILAHLVIYEETMAAPVLEALAAGGDGVDAAPSPGEGSLSAAKAISDSAVEELLERLAASRTRQIEIVKSYAPERFNEPVTSLWVNSPIHGRSLHSAGWVATKTFQHTWEHGNAIMRVALFAPRGS